MGFIREPKGVDFFVVNKPFTAAEKKEFSLLIQNLKRRKKRTIRRAHARRRPKTIA